MRAPGHRIGSHAEPDRQRPGTNYPVDTLPRRSIPIAISTPRARRPFPLDRATLSDVKGRGTRDEDEAVVRKPERRKRANDF